MQSNGEVSTKQEEKFCMNLGNPKGKANHTQKLIDIMRKFVGRLLAL